MIGHVGRQKMNLFLEDTIEGAQLEPMFLMTRNLVPYTTTTVTRGGLVPVDTTIEAMRLDDINLHAQNIIPCPRIRDVMTAQEYVLI